jgi:hypothetical protein
LSWKLHWRLIAGIKREDYKAAFADAQEEVASTSRKKPASGL